MDNLTAPQMVMDQLDSLGNNNSIYSLLGLLRNKLATVEINNWYSEQVDEIEDINTDAVNQKIIDFAIWKKPTIQLERTPHYVILVHVNDSFYYTYYLDSNNMMTNESNKEASSLGYENGWEYAAVHSRLNDLKPEKSGYTWEFVEVK